MIRKGLIARGKKKNPTELATTGPLEAFSQKENHTESWGFGRRSQSSEKVKEGCSKKREQHVQRFRRNSTWLPPQCSHREQQKSLGKRTEHVLEVFGPWTAPHRRRYLCLKAVSGSFQCNQRSRHLPNPDSRSHCLAPQPKFAWAQDS